MIITPTQIFKQNQVLTVAAAKSLIGKKIYITSPEYRMNKATVKELIVKKVISEWDKSADDQLDGWANRQQYWQSYMTESQIENQKERLLLIGQDGYHYAVAHTGRDNFYTEPTFTGSDADRTVFYIVDMIDNFVVVYEEDMDGIATTERMIFSLDNREDAEAYYNKMVQEQSKEVLLCIVLKGFTNSEG